MKRYALNIDGSAGRFIEGEAVLLNDGTPAYYSMCSIPDDHIDPRRWALFVARSILTELRDGGRTC